MIEGVQIMTTGTTSYVYLRSQKIGSINYPGASSEKPYHASSIYDDNYALLFLPMDQHVKNIMDRSFKTQNEAVDYITKRHFEKIKNNS